MHLAAGVRRASLARLSASSSCDRGPLNPTQETGVFRFHELLRAAYRAKAGG
jgi:hypothetical protein